MVGFYPPLANTVKSLLYFADYSLEEYEPVLDENMLVYSYGDLDTGVTSGGVSSAAFEATAEDFLYLGHKHAEATKHSSGGATLLFGFTGHSCSILRLGSNTTENKTLRIRCTLRLWSLRRMIWNCLGRSTPAIT